MRKNGTNVSRLSRKIIFHVEHFQLRIFILLNYDFPGGRVFSCRVLLSPKSLKDVVEILLQQNFFSAFKILDFELTSNFGF